MGMRALHVGIGTTRGAMTVFPVWGEFAELGRHTVDAASVAVAEQEGAPSVGFLQARNLHDLPVVMFQGQVVEGGWQNRMVARSVVVPARGHADLEVVCVEEGRWGGGTGHRAGGRRASGRVRAGLTQHVNPQGAVWAQVREYERTGGPTETTSYTEHADRRGGDVERLVAGLRPLPGQIGVVVALAGQPLFAEVFDDHDTLVAQFDAVVRAAAVDAIGLPEVATPSRRARRFIDRAQRVSVTEAEPAGLGCTVRGRDEYVDVTGLAWNGVEAHMVMTNPRHELCALGA